MRMVSKIVFGLVAGFIGVSTVSLFYAYYVAGELPEVLTGKNIAIFTVVILAIVISAIAISPRRQTYADTQAVSEPDFIIGGPPEEYIYCPNVNCRKGFLRSQIVRTELVRSDLKTAYVYLQCPKCTHPISEVQVQRLNWPYNLRPPNMP